MERGIIVNKYIAKQTPYKIIKSTIAMYAELVSEDLAVTLSGFLILYSNICEYNVAKIKNKNSDNVSTEPYKPAEYKTFANSLPSSKNTKNTDATSISKQMVCIYNRSLLVLVMRINNPAFINDFIILILFIPKKSHGRNRGSNLHKY